MTMSGNLFSLCSALEVRFAGLPKRNLIAKLLKLEKKYGLLLCYNATYHRSRQEHNIAKWLGS
jgi:hypothetical protein